MTRRDETIRWVVPATDYAANTGLSDQEMAERVTDATIERLEHIAETLLRIEAHVAQRERS